MTSHLKKGLELVPWTGDLACFIIHIDEKLQGTIGIHVHESIG